MSRQKDSITSSTRTFMAPDTLKKPEVTKVPKEKRRTFRIPRISWLIIIILIALSAFLFSQYRSAQTKLKDTKTPIANKQVADVIQAVGKLVIVPKSETPTVATVLHADKVKDQTFFTDARDGDKVLVYGKEKRAILYRPSTNQIVNISTVSTSPAATAQ